MAEIASIAESNPDRTRSIIETLTENAYLNETGRRNGLLKIWVATQKCRDTPTPPRLYFGQGAFAQERRAVARLVEVFMSDADLSGARTAESIREQLDVLNRRFAKKEVKDDY